MNHVARRRRRQPIRLRYALKAAADLGSVKRRERLYHRPVLLEGGLVSYYSPTRERWVVGCPGVPPEDLDMMPMRDRDLILSHQPSRTP